MKKVETKTILIHGRGRGKTFCAKALQDVYHTTPGTLSVLRNVGSDKEAAAAKVEFAGRVDFLILVAGYPVDVRSLNPDQAIEISGGEGFVSYPRVA